jgi:hypothetical protein
MLINMIDMHGKNPLVYLNGRLLTQSQYTYNERELAPAMMGWAGAYEPEDIGFTESILTGDVLIIVYPNRRYEYMLNRLPHRGTRIKLRVDPCKEDRSGP